MYKVLCILLLNFWIHSITVSAKDEFCQDYKVASSKSNFATKTGYLSANKDDSLAKQLDDEVSKLGCKAQQVWILSRHGTRFPIKKEIKRMGSTLPLIAQEIVFNHKEGRGCLSEEEAKEFESFALPYTLRDGGQLHETGSDEHFALGQFWKEKFPEIFGAKFSDSVYKLEYTTANRTAQSAYHFLKGMFGEEETAQIKLPTPRSPNFKLRPYKSCPLWLRQVYNNEDTLKKQKLYENSEEFTRVLKLMSQRLGYIETLPVNELALIYDECRYETAWWPDKQSVWCAPFSEHDLEVLEYHQALKYYYQDSHGGPPVISQLGCTAAADLYKRFQKSVDGVEGVPQGVLYFSHDHAIMHFLTALGLFAPKEDLEPHNREEIEEEGRYIISDIAPFATNVAFALYKCNGGSHRVAGFLQGQPMSLSPLLCSSEDSVSCPWPLQALQEIADTCSVRAVCNTHDEL